MCTGIARVCFGLVLLDFMVRGPVFGLTWFLHVLAVRGFYGLRKRRDRIWFGFWTVVMDFIVTGARFVLTLFLLSWFGHGIYAVCTSMDRIYEWVFGLFLLEFMVMGTLFEMS